MDMFFWFMIAIAVVAYLISNGKRKRKQEPYRCAPTKEQEYRDLVEYLNIGEKKPLLNAS